MERGLRAFFYDYHYYLFPDGMTLEELRVAGQGVRQTPQRGALHGARLHL